MNTDKLEMGGVELINKLFSTLNEPRITELSNELLETLKIIENCTSCCCYFDKLTNEIAHSLAELKNEQNVIYKSSGILIDIDNKTNREVLCKECKRKKIEKLADKCGNEEIARFLYNCKLLHYGDCNSINLIKWIPFNEFRSIEYLAKGGFGEVHKAIWVRYDYDKYEEVVLKRIYNSSDKIIDILKEVGKVYH